MNQDLYKLLFEKMFNGFAYYQIILDDKGQPIDYVFLEVNQAFEQLSGLGRDKVLGRRVTEVLPEMGEDSADWIEKYGKAALSGRETCFECFSKHTDKWFSVMAVQPEPEHLALVFEDVTETKKLEAQLFHSQKMESLGRLAGGIAHDFNNLMTIVTGYCDLLLPRLASSDAAKRDIEEVRKAGVRAASLTRQLLAFSKKQVMRPEVLNLNGVIRNVRKMLLRFIGEDVELIISLDDNLGQAKADPGQLEQIIMNLVVNARDAMPLGGTLSIETANRELDEEYARIHIDANPGKYVMLAVSDTGCGMSEEIQSKIFEPFFTTKKKQGTGLGLSTVFGIIKQSGGHIWVYSEEGKGTSFKIYLPRVEEKYTPQLSTTVLSRTIGTSETVLLVEDDDAVREVTKRMLESYNYEVLTAGCGKEAIGVCEAHKGEVGLLLTDVVMPEMSGSELSAKLRERWPALKTLFMSGYTDNTIGHHGITAGGSFFIEKPFAPKNLVRKVREVLETDILQ